MSIITDVLIVAIAWILFFSFKAVEQLWSRFASRSQRESCQMCSEYVLQRQTVATPEAEDGAVPRAGFVRILKEPATFQIGVKTELHQHACFIPAPCVYGPPASCLLNTVPVSCWRCDRRNAHFFDLPAHNHAATADLMAEVPLEILEHESAMGYGRFGKVEPAGMGSAGFCTSDVSSTSSGSQKAAPFSALNPDFRRVFEKYANAECVDAEALTYSESLHDERSFTQLCWDACPKTPFGMPQEASVRLTRPRDIAKPVEPEEHFTKSNRRFGRFRRCGSCSVSPRRMCGVGEAGIRAKTNTAAFNVSSKEADEARQYKLRFGVSDPKGEEKEWFEKYKS